MPARTPRFQSKPRIGPDGDLFASASDIRQLNFSRDAMLNENEAAQYRGESRRTLQRERLSGDGCPYIQLSERRIAYRFGDLVDWIASRRRSSTSHATVARAAAEDRAA